MNVLLIGGCGYIGGWMTNYLAERGYDITVYDNLLYETRFTKDVPFIFGDIRDTEKLSKIIHDFDVVIWLAALVGDGACAVNPNLTKIINTDTVKWLADNFKGKVVFCSTCSVYGKNDGLLDETSPVNPLSVYASTKYEAEQHLLNKKPDSLIWRLGTLFGVGDDHSRIRLDLVANVLSMKASRGETLTVFGGEQWRPLLHVRDVASATHFGLQNNISGLFNLTYKNYLLKEIAEEIVSVIPGAGISYSAMPFEDMRNYRVSGDKFKSIQGHDGRGWQPDLDLATGVKQIQWLISQGRIKDTTDPIYSNAAFVKKLGGF